MRKLTATLCLTIVMLLGSVGLSWGNNQNPNTDTETFVVSPDQDGNCPKGTLHHMDNDTCIIDPIRKMMSGQEWKAYQSQKNCSNKDREYAKFLGNHYDPEDAYEFGRKIKKLVKEKNLEGLFTLVEGELISGPRKRFIKGKKFSDIFPENWTNKLLTSGSPCSPGGLERRFMLGNGLLWFDCYRQNGRTVPCKITGINGAIGEEMSLTIIDKLFQERTKICEKAGYGEYLLTDNPVKLVDISNDGIKDLIIDTSKQRCKKSYSFFAGGTGGNDFIFFINPTINIVKSWSPSQFGGNYKDRIFTMLIRRYEVVKWKGKNALKIHSHGINCGVDGATGCYSILSASEEGLKILKNPTPRSEKY